MKPATPPSGNVAHGHRAAVQPTPHPFLCPQPKTKTTNPLLLVPRLFWFTRLSVLPRVQLPRRALRRGIDDRRRKGSLRRRARHLPVLPDLGRRRRPYGGVGVLLHLEAVSAQHKLCTMGVTRFLAQPFTFCAKYFRLTGSSSTEALSSTVVFIGPFSPVMTRSPREGLKTSRGSGRVESSQVG